MEILNSVRFRYFFHEIPRFRFGFGIYGVFKKTVKKREKKLFTKLPKRYLVLSICHQQQRKPEVPKWRYLQMK